MPSVSEDTQPIKRGPGRPRKPVDHQPKHAAVEPQPEDPRIGQDCDPDWAVVTFSDTGNMYRCENGKIVERVR
jgi:hypothetical protein